MATRYHYDRNGNYRGMSTDEPPKDDGCLIAALAIIAVCIFFGGC